MADQKSIGFNPGDWSAGATLRLNGAIRHELAADAGVETVNRRYGERQDRRVSRFLYDERGELRTRHEDDGTVSSASPAVEALLGRLPWQVEGRRWHDFVHRDDVSTFTAWWSGLGRGGQATHLYRLCRPNGSVASVETLARRLVIVEKRMVEVHALTRDVTAHVERADDLARQCRGLEDSIGDLARHNEDLARFAADAAHDLRAPLQSITGFVQLLVRREGARLDETSQRFLAMVLAAAGDMGNLLEAALDHAQATATPARFVPVDCTEIVQRSLLRLSAELESTGATVEVKALPVVHADPIQLGRIFQNRSGPSGRPVHVVVAAHRVFRGWHLSVSDDGTGVSPDDRDRIFQLFHRGGETRYDGRGIGLAICRNLVEQHHGRIWVESGPKSGSRFAFFLPDSG